jgi:ribonuclease-3
MEVAGAIVDKRETPMSAAGPARGGGEAERKFRQFLETSGVDLGENGLFRRALLHRSYASENGLDVDNERLEFLGDAVISLIVSERVYAGQEDAREGKLSKQRASIVSRNNLGRVGRAIGLGDWMRVGVGEERSGGRKRLSTVGSCLEAIIGALYLEHGLELAREFIEEFIMDEGGVSTAERRAWDSKSLLQEWTQREWKMAPDYRVIETTGPDHARHFRVDVFIGGKRLARGEGRRIKEAENAAAAEALRIIEENDGLDGS